MNRCFRASSILILHIYPLQFKILAFYANEFHHLNFDVFAAMFILFLWFSYKNSGVQNNILSPSMGWSAWIVIQSKWVWMFIGLTGDGESTLAQIHVIRNLLITECYYFISLFCLAVHASSYNQLYIQPIFACSRRLFCINC